MNINDYAREDEQYHYFSDEFLFECCMGLEHVLKRKFSNMTQTYSLELACPIQAINSSLSAYTIHSDAFETEIAGELVVLGKFKIYTGNCVLATLKCKLEMDRKTTSNMIRWLGNRDLMKFCKIVEKFG